MLTEERGALELQIPLSIMGRSAQEIVKAIETRKNALQMSSQEFEQQQKEALAQIEAIRAQKTDEKQRLRNSANAAKAQLTDQVTNFYPALKEQLEGVLERTQIDPASLGTKGGQDAAVAVLQKAVNQEMETAMSGFFREDRNAAAGHRRKGSGQAWKLHGGNCRAAGQPEGRHRNGKLSEGGRFRQCGSGVRLGHDGRRLRTGRLYRGL